MSETADLVNKLIMGITPTIMVITCALATWRIWIHGMGIMNAKNVETKKEEWKAIYWVIGALVVIILAGTIVLVLKDDIVRHYVNNTVINSIFFGN